MGKQNEDDDDEMYVDLELDDGTVTCSIVAIFSASNGKDYIALLPLDEDGENIKTSLELIVINGENYDSAAETRVIGASGKTIEKTLDQIASSLTKPMLHNHCGIIAIGAGID